MNKKNTKKNNKRLEKNYYISLMVTAELFMNLIDRAIPVKGSYLGYQKNFDKRAIKFLKKNNENF